MTIYLNYRDTVAYSNMYCYNLSTVEYTIYKSSVDISNINEYILDNIGYHNISGPALQVNHDNGNIHREYYKILNKLHNRRGPADIIYYETGEVYYEIYVINNIVHNENGPAKIQYARDGSIVFTCDYINGEFIKDSRYP